MMSLARDRRVEPTAASRRRKRGPVSCDECRRSKLRCDRQFPCGTCKHRGRGADCHYGVVIHAPSSTKSQSQTAPPRASTGLRSREVSSPNPSRLNFLSSSPLHNDLPTSEPNRTPLHAQWETVLERPTPERDPRDTLSSLSIAPCMSLQEIIDSLPSKPCCDYLISRFFKNIFPLFPILHGPTFQKQYQAFMRRTHDIDLPWLALLFSLCSVSLSTMDESDPRLSSFKFETPSGPTQLPITVSLSRRLLQTAMTCLLRDDFFVRHTFSTFEALLMVIYSFSHNESVDQGWALLGMALNIGIALRCNVDQNLSPIETERRRRCWAGLLTLHTYQGILFRDVDMSYLLNIKVPLPADIDDVDVTDEGISQLPSRRKPTQMSVMMCKIRLFRLATHICRHISGPSQLDPDLLQGFDGAISEEQKHWDLILMTDGSPNVLDPTSYAFWCVLQTYAHHLYLLLHRQFHHSRASSYLPSSRARCISSSTALLSIHKQLYEAPLLRDYLWLLSGVTSLKALHAAVALNSCLQDITSTSDPGYDLDTFRDDIESLTLRMESLSGRSNICSRAHRILCHLQAQRGAPNRTAVSAESLLEDWTNIRDWIDADLTYWNLERTFD